MGSFLLVRAPHWHLRRIFFLLALAWASQGVALGPTNPIEKTIALLVAGPLAQALTLWFFFSWAEKGRPGRLRQALTWIVGISYFVVQALWWVLTLPTGTLPASLLGALVIITAPIFLGTLVQTYRRSEPFERRQLRWILYAMFLGTVPIAVAHVALALVPQFDERFFTLGWSLVGWSRSALRWPWWATAG